MHGNLRFEPASEAEARAHSSELVLKDEGLPGCTGILYASYILYRTIKCIILCRFSVQVCPMLWHTMVILLLVKPRSSAVYLTGFSTA